LSTIRATSFFNRDVSQAGLRRIPRDVSKIPTPDL